MLHKISMLDHYKRIGIKAYTDGCSYDEHGYVYLVSILGHDSAVKGLSSAIVMHRDVTIDLDDNYEIKLCAIPGEKYRILSAKLNSGFLHQIVVLDAVLQKTNNKFFYIDDKKKTNNIIFSIIKKNFSTPVLPEWKNWLIKQIKEQALMKIMQGNIQLAKINFNEKQLDSIISNGVRAGSIRF